MYYPKYAMFFDFHTMKQCPEVGHKFNPEEFASTLESAGVDFIGFHAKCNQGFSYYDTKIGTRHPSLPEKFDLFGETVQACNRHGIQVSAYLNCGLSNEIAVQHPEWCQIGENNQIYHPEVMASQVTPYMRLMCINSPYRDYFLAQVEEIVEKYPVAGFLFDSFNAFSCVCPHCIRGMREAGMDFTNPEDVKKFAYMSAVRMAEDISALLRSRNPELLHYYLGLRPVDNAYHVSPSRMSTLFKGEMGIGFTDCIWKLRLEKAQKLLLTTELSVEEISLLVGYLAHSSFGRKFKQETGMTPSQYREQNAKSEAASQP